jgi:hypothetical protein
MTATLRTVPALRGAATRTRRLFIAASIGRARTELAAFDHALTLAGVADHNLVRALVSCAYAAEPWR